MIMCENRMCTYMSNWVTMLYTRKKICVGEITIKKIIIMTTTKKHSFKLFLDNKNGVWEFPSWRSG